MLYHRHIDIAFHPVTLYSRQWGNRPCVLDLSFKSRALRKREDQVPFLQSLVWPGRESNPRTPGEHFTTRPLGAVIKMVAFGIFRKEYSGVNGGVYFLFKLASQLCYISRQKYVSLSLFLPECQKWLITKWNVVPVNSYHWWQSAIKHEL